jgi:excisionase family DNA binding protein
MEHRKPRYRIDEAAELLDISRAWAYRQIAAGKLLVVKDGRRSFVTAAEIDRYARGGAQLAASVDRFPPPPNIFSPPPAA